MAKNGEADPAIDAIRAWMRLNDALGAFDRNLRKTHGVTGGQLAILRIIAETEPTLAELRTRLSMHPATLGQIVDRIAKLGLIDVTVSASDRRGRDLTITARGCELLSVAPVAGPVRLRGTADASRARRLQAAFDDAIEAFGVQEWART